MEDRRNFIKIAGLSIASLAVVFSIPAMLFGKENKKDKAQEKLRNRIISTSEWEDNEYINKKEK